MMLELGNLFKQGDFTLNSGIKSSFKIDCDALTDQDIDCLAQMIRELAGPFSTVEGIPTGGLRLAESLRRYKMGNSHPHLIVDDVLTTGGSMERMRHRIAQDTDTLHQKFIGVVVFARGQCPIWIKAVFQMPEVFWTKPKHR